MAQQRQPAPVRIAQCIDCSGQWELQTYFPNRRRRCPACQEVVDSPAGLNEQDDSKRGTGRTYAMLIRVVEQYIRTGRRQIVIIRRLAERPHIDAMLKHIAGPVYNDGMVLFKPVNAFEYHSPTHEDVWVDHHAEEDMG